ncbi:MAG: hypothetical protein QM497_07750, partial [Sulfurimonas sp.]
MKKSIISSVLIGLVVLGLESGASSTSMSIKAQVNAVNKSWDAIKNIKNPAKEAQIAAVKTSWQAIEYIKNPVKEAQ